MCNKCLFVQIIPDQDSHNIGKKEVYLRTTQGQCIVGTDHHSHEVAWPNRNTNANTIFKYKYKYTRTTRGQCIVEGRNWPLQSWVRVTSSPVLYFVYFYPADKPRRGNKKPRTNLGEAGGQQKNEIKMALVYYLIFHNPPHTHSSFLAAQPAVYLLCNEGLLLWHLNKF